MAIGKGSRYKGIFIFPNEVLVRFTHAKSEKQARVRLLSQIQREKKVKYISDLYRVFDGSKDNYKITIESA